MWLPSKILKARAAKRRAGARTSVDSWPFLGVSITLLIIFMLVTGHQPHHTVYMDLPLSTTATSQPKANRDDAMRVVVSRDGSVFFRNMKIAPEELSSLIRQAVKKGAERKVYLAVDSRARYAEVEPVLDRVREVGIWDVVVLTDKREVH